MAFSILVTLIMIFALSLVISENLLTPTFTCPSSRGHVALVSHNIRDIILPIITTIKTKTSQFLLQPTHWAGYVEITEYGFVDIGVRRQQKKWQIYGQVTKHAPRFSHLVYKWRHIMSKTQWCLIGGGRYESWMWPTKGLNYKKIYDNREILLLSV